MHNRSRHTPQPLQEATSTREPLAIERPRATPRWQLDAQPTTATSRLRREPTPAASTHQLLRTRDALAGLDQARELTVQALVAALHLRDDETASHTRRVTAIALRLTDAIDPALAKEPELRRGFLLHDLGKIGIPDTILLKPGPLNPHERRLLETHTLLGEQLVSSIPYLSCLARQVIACHHERWDGRGYPWRLSGTNIPLPARIFAVADAFDAMTSHRPYRKAIPLQQALDEIRSGAGNQFDPTIVTAFLSITDTPPTLTDPTPTPLPHDLLPEWNNRLSGWHVREAFRRAEADRHHAHA